MGIEEHHQTVDFTMNNYIEPDYEEYVKEVYTYNRHQPLSFAPHNQRVDSSKQPGWTRRQDSLLSDFGRLVPFLLALPVMAAASYYLVVLNGPTPVVKERSENTLALMAQRTLSQVLSMIEESY